jgi:beta-xylosidase
MKWMMILFLSVPLHGRSAQYLIEGADPDACFDGETYYLSCTHSTTRILPFLTSTNGADFTPFTEYDPSKIDSKYDYYCVWAPDIAQWEGKFILFFSAIRLSKGEKEKSYDDFIADGHQVTTFFSTAKNNRLEFSKPHLLRQCRRRNTTGEFNILATLLHHNAERTVRIDAELFTENNTARLFYVWFHHGNNISSASWPNLNHLIHHVRPAKKDEEHVTEAPCVFKRNGLYYLIYSHGHFTGKYGMSYIMADSLEKLSKQQQVYPLYRASYDMDGNLIQNGGHCSVVEHDNELVIFYHKGSWKASTGKNNRKKRGFRRDIYRDTLTFNPDGTIQILH